MENNTGIEFIDDMGGESFFNKATTTISKLLIILTFIGVLFALFNRGQMIDQNTRAIEKNSLQIEKLIEFKTDISKHNEDMQLLRNDLKDMRQWIAITVQHKG